MTICKNCSSEIDDKFDDNYNLHHTVLFCPECGFSNNADGDELAESKTGEGLSND